MFIIGKLADIPSRSIIEDLVSRNSSPDNISPCPYNGKGKWFYEQTKGYNIDVIKVLNSIEDFSAVKIKAIKGVSRPSTQIMKTMTHTPEKRLEYIDETWVEAYLNMILYSLKKHAKNSFVEEEKESQEHRMFTDSEDGTLRSEAELAIEFQSVRYDHQIQYKDLMISILNQLHNESKIRGISYISAIICYERCKKRMIRYNKSSNKDGNTVPYIKDILDEGVYKMSREGVMYGPPVKDNTTFNDIYKWLRGSNPNDPLYKDVTQLIAMCDKLEIHLEHEDPFDYNEEFFKQLTITYLKSNRDYPLTERVKVNKKNLEFLTEVTTQEFHDKNEILIENRRVEDKLNSIALNFRFIIEDKRGIAINRESLSDRFIRKYGEYNDKVRMYQPNNFVIEDGFYKRRFSKIPELFIVTDITLKPALNRSQAMLHSSGYLVLYINSDDIYVLDVNDALAYMRDKYNNSIKSGQAYSKQKIFGSWENWA